MGAWSRAGQRSVFPRGLLGMIVLLALIESSIARHALDFTRFYIHDWRVAGLSARTQSAGCDVLCFGDSLVKFGVVPRVLQRRLEATVYNLAICDGQAASSYFLLRRALAAGARPRALIVDFAPHLLAADPRHNLRQWPELIEPLEGIDLGLATKHAGFFASLTLGWVLPSVKDHHEIRGNILAALRGQSGSHRQEIPAYQHTWEQERGAMVCAERPEYRGEGDLGNPAYFPHSWRCHPVNEGYIRRVLDLAASRSIEVFWLLPPLTPSFQSRRDELGLEASHDRFLRSFQDRYPGLFVIDARHAGYGVGDFIDPLHLNRRGASALSTALADAVARSFGSRPAVGRWIVLSRAAQDATSAKGTRVAEATTRSVTPP